MHSGYQERGTYANKQKYNARIAHISSEGPLALSKPGPARNNYETYKAARTINHNRYMAELTLMLARP